MIDRSKPLPIHQFPDLIDEVAKLKELAKREASATYRQAGDEFGYECAVLNVMPELLAVLSGFQAGDDKLLREAIYDAIDVEKGEKADRIVACLRRYRDMAHAMEGHKMTCKWENGKNSSGRIKCLVSASAKCDYRHNQTSCPKYQEVTR